MKFVVGYARDAPDVKLGLVAYDNGRYVSRFRPLEEVREKLSRLSQTAIHFLQDVPLIYAELIREDGFSFASLPPHNSKYQPSFSHCEFTMPEESGISFDAAYNWYVKGMIIKNQSPAA